MEQPGFNPENFNLPEAVANRETKERQAAAGVAEQFRAAEGNLAERPVLDLELERSL